MSPDLDPAQVTVRLATAADHEAVVACVTAAYTPYITEIGVAPAPLQDDYAAHIACGRVWLAIGGNGEIAGLVVILIEAEHLLIDNYAVRPEWQNRGISKILTARAMRETRRLGLARLRLYTHAKMTRNPAMYRRARMGRGRATHGARLRPRLHGAMAGSRRRLAMTSGRRPVLPTADGRGHRSAATRLGGSRGAVGHGFACAHGAMAGSQ